MEMLGVYALRLLIFGSCAAMLGTVALDAAGYIYHDTGRTIAAYLFYPMIGGVVLIGGALVFGPGNEEEVDGESC